MINSNGEKIVDNQEKIDPVFKLKEIKFFIKIFAKTPSDELAYGIAEDMYAYLKADGFFHEIKAEFIELCNYIKYTFSDDFVWEMVYILRRMCENLGNSKADLLYASKCKLAAAECFDKICEIRPSWHNQYVRILENITAIVGLDKLKGKDHDDFKIKKLTGYTKELFDKLENNGKSNYYSLGLRVYKVWRIVYLKDCNDELMYNVIRKMNYFAREYYAAEDLPETLGDIAFSYEVMSCYEQFSYEEEKENIELAIKWVNLEMEYCPPGRLFRELEDILQTLNGLKLKRKSY